MLSFTPPALKTKDNQLKLSRASSIRSTSKGSSCCSSSPPKIPIKPGHLRSTSSQIKVQDRIIRAVEIRQDPSLSLQIEFPTSINGYHGDQPTIKASQHRPPRENASTMRKLMEHHESTIRPSLPKTDENVYDSRKKQSETFRNNVQRLAPSESSPSNQTVMNLETDKQSYLLPKARDGVSTVPQQISTFTPLVPPQLAIALHRYVPEVSDLDSDAGECDSDTLTPEVRFESQDLLEIWVANIGGGWSLGKNLTNPNIQPRQSRLELNQGQGGNLSDLGLIPIRWYQVIQPFGTCQSRCKQENSTSALLTPSNSTDPAFLPQDKDYGRSYGKIDPINPNAIGFKSFLSHRVAQDYLDTRIYSSNIKIARTTSSSLDDLNVMKTRQNSSSDSSKKSSDSFDSNSSERASRFVLFTPISDPSVALNKDFATNGVFLDSNSCGNACSVTASDAMRAARQAHDRQKADQVDLQGHSSNKQRISSWNLSLPIAVSSRYSVARSYITGTTDCEKYPQNEQDCTERYEIEAGPIWKDPVPSFTIDVHHPKLQMHQSKTKAHMIYIVTSTFFVGDSAQDGRLNRVNVERRYSHFELLSRGLHSMFGEVFDLPILPEKAYVTKYDEGFLRDRRRGLERYLVRLARHPVLRYCPKFTTFLGCDDVEDFEQEARTWSQSHLSPSRKAISQDSELSASSSFFSKVFHPDYNVDDGEVRDSIESYNKHTKSMENEKAMIDLEKNLSNLRRSIQNVSRDYQKMSNSIERLCAGLSSPHEPLPLSRKQRMWASEESGSLPRETHHSALQNSDGALCWKEGCADCLAMTQALQLLGQSLGNAADTYSACAIETLAPVQDLLKELSLPHRSRKVLSNLYDSTKVPFSEFNTHCSVDGFESRKETVMNVVMSEIERHHQEKQHDYRDFTKKLMDSQIKLHQTAFDQLKEARKALDQGQLTILRSSEPRHINSEETLGSARQELNVSNSAVNFFSTGSPKSKVGRGSQNQSTFDEQVIHG